MAKKVEEKKPAKTLRDKVHRISGGADDMVREYAKVRGIEVGEAADALIQTGYKRLLALARYNGKEVGATVKRARTPKGKKARGKKAAKKTKARERPKPEVETEETEAGRNPFSEGEESGETASNDEEE